MITQGAHHTRWGPASELASLELRRDWALLVLGAALLSWTLVGLAMALTMGLASVAAGSIVGTAVGVAQAHVLTSRLGVRRAAWVAVSLLAGTAGWSLSGHGGFSILRSDAW